jgi:hypothetical protein
LFMRECSGRRRQAQSQTSGIITTRAPLKTQNIDLKIERSV